MYDNRILERSGNPVLAGPITNNRNRAVFIDRDGTIMKEKNYISDPKEVELLPHSIAAIKLLRSAGFKLFVVTNQAGVSRGYFSLETLHTTHNRLIELLKIEDTYLDKIYFCPHRPEDNCDCRKPKLGMIKQAQNEFNIDLTHSYIIGDRSEDIELGKALNLQAILVLTGYGKYTFNISHTESKFTTPYPADEILSDYGINTLRPVSPDFVANDLLEATNWICKER